MDDLYTQIKRFMEPESIAVVGVSTRTGPGSFNAMETILERGYRGRVYGVNPKGGEILGVKVYPSVTDLPEVVDLAVISTPRGAVPGIVRECVAKGIKAVIIIGQGFADGDEEGKRMQEEIMASIRGTETRIAGPNTLGVANAYAGFYTAFFNFTNKKVANGVVCQSGIFLGGAMDFCTGVGLGIDIGNTADVDFSDVLEYFGREDRVQVISMHIEGLKDGRRFLETASRVSRIKPIICYKTGRSEAGAKAAGSHSGSLAGEDHVYDAALRQAGVIRVEDGDELNDLNKTFLTYPGIGGRRIAIVTITGGGGIATVDACERYGLEVAAYSPETMALLKSLYPDWMEPGNPSDIWPAGMGKGYHMVTARVLEQVLNDPGVDAVVCITPAYMPPEKDLFTVSDIIKEAAARHRDKPLAVWIFAPHKRELGAIFEEDGTIAVYPTPERAVRALAALYRYYHGIKPAPLPQAETPAGVDLKRAARILRAGKAPGPRTILGEDAFAVLQAYGIPTVRSGRAAGREEALRLAGQMGFPLVMKLDSPDISHKSEVGGVVTGIAGLDAVGAAYDGIMASVAVRAPGARVEGVILQECVTGGVEVILGARRDPQFGPVLVYGLGGIYTEILRDVSFRVAPVDRAEALKMMAETKTYPLLTGARGRTAADVEALAGTIVRLSQLLLDCPEILEMDINPLMAGPDGVVALDARIVTDRP
ncbi:MAG: acetate--CoA ligase family protein [Firmicutes bacterium]|nr:acetate--CoA ligase family protein [Bacillota bacterium]